MYNRYLSHDEGTYQPVTPFTNENPSRPSTGYQSTGGNKANGFLSSIFEKFRLDRFDKEDLLLALILFLLYSDSEDEELLFAMILLFLL